MRKYYILLYITSFFIFLPGCGEELLPSYHRKPVGNIAVYKERLEQRLLYKYKNHPRYGKNIDRVELDVVKDIKSDSYGKLRKVEFSQLVYDIWGKRIPELEKEYFIVTFGPKNRHRLSMPGKKKISVGLNTRGGYSEHIPVNSGEVGRARKNEIYAKGAYCPVCGNKVEKSGICYECLNRNSLKGKNSISKTTVNPYRLDIDNSLYNSNEQKFTEEVTRKVKRNLKLKALREGYDINNNEFNDLKTIKENITPPKINTSKMNLPNRRFGGTKNIPARQQNRVYITNPAKPNASKDFNEMRKNIDKQVDHNRMNAIATQKIIINEEDRSFGVVNIERKIKAEVRSKRY